MRRCQHKALADNTVEADRYPVEVRQRRDERSQRVDEVLGCARVVRQHTDAGRDERYDYIYRENELEEWKERARRLAGRSENLYIITNNHFRGQALVNAFQLKFLLGRGRQEMPGSLIEAYPELRSIAIDGPGQGTLL